MTQANKISNILALDVGSTRVGVALANTVARIASPLTTLIYDDSFWHNLGKILSDEHVSLVVVGLPRNLQGNDTDQTRTIRAFTEKLKATCNVDVVLQDEALTSKKAEAELRSRGKGFSKGDVDALAATYILEDYLDTGAL